MELTILIAVFGCAVLYLSSKQMARCCGVVRPLPTERETPLSFLNVKEKYYGRKYESKHLCRRER